LQKLVADARDTLQKVGPDTVNARAGADMVFEIRGTKVPFTAEGFVRSFSLPNFYFHATTAYDICDRKAFRSESGTTWADAAEELSPAVPKAVWNGAVVAEAAADDVRIVEGNVYFSPDAVDHTYLRESKTTTVVRLEGHRQLLRRRRRRRNQPRRRLVLPCAEAGRGGNRRLHRVLERREDRGRRVALAMHPEHKPKPLAACNVCHAPTNKHEELNQRCDKVVNVEGATVPTRAR
jgi:hypothetical protein